MEKGREREREIGLFIISLTITPEAWVCRKDWIGKAAYASLGVAAKAWHCLLFR